MGKGVANVWRYYQVGIGSNHRYLDVLAAAPLKGEGVAALDALCRSTTKDGRHHARFNPLTPADRALFRAVLAVGQFHQRVPQHRPGGQALPTITRQHRRGTSTMRTVSRLIAKLRGHGLVAKVPRSACTGPPNVVTE